jgi:chaperonin GroES
MRPLKDRVLVRPIQEEERTKSGLFMPENRSKKPPKFAEVLAVGPWQDSVKPGEKVLLAPFAGTEMKWEDELLLVVEAVDIFAVVED